jgi:hypothetical protein
LPDIVDMTPGELGRFNDALSFWITKENAPGNSP